MNGKPFLKRGEGLTSSKGMILERERMEKQQRLLKKGNHPSIIQKCVIATKPVSGPSPECLPPSLASPPHSPASPPPSPPGYPPLPVCPPPSPVSPPPSPPGYPPLPVYIPSQYIPSPVYPPSPGYILLHINEVPPLEEENVEILDKSRVFSEMVSNFLNEKMFDKNSIVSILTKGGIGIPPGANTKLERVNVLKLALKENKFPIECLTRQCLTRLMKAVQVCEEPNSTKSCIRQKLSEKAIELGY
jgi:hypothetical protein